jgi:CRP/FNR family cyclic AMP-dependent transcriptional regulator
MKRLSSSREERTAALQENRYLSGLDNGILEFLSKNTQLLSFEADEVIFREGQPCLGLYIIVSGRVKIFKYSHSGREMIINVCEPGDSFNEVPVFDRLDNPVNVGAVLDTRVWLIDAEALRQVVVNHPEAAQKIIINLSQNLRMLVKKIAELTFYPVTARLARLLYDLPPEQLSGAERFTQDDLASRVGTVREVVARALKELENSGAIEIQRGKIKVLDLDKLRGWE